MAPDDSSKSALKLTLPKTDFPMKADLPKREPAILERWKSEKLFERILAGRADAPKFAFHDGPPYANGHIHQGHVLNKILKDLVVKYKTMAGFRVDYIPGWDCHGLPIERELEKELGMEKKAKMAAVEFRRACRDYATKWVGIQRDEFRRLGVFGRWDDPYLTMAPGYEAIIAREFGRFVGNGGAYKGKKPVHWCWHDQTALAEAEVEYAEHESPSIYVKFELPADQLPADARKALGSRKAYVVIWTTTPWTLPANLGIALHPKLEYVLVEPQGFGGAGAPPNGARQEPEGRPSAAPSATGEGWIVAKGMLERFEEAAKTGALQVLAAIDPKELEKKNARHPFLDRRSLLVLADYVTLEAGTGCVHTAPGHGADDFATGQRYGLETLAPVDDRGVLTAEAGPFAGQHVYKANAPIIEALRASGHLVAEKKLKHDYPHCWRCKKPVIFRATTQWFISMEKNDLRKDALAAIDQTKWIPPYGRDRIHGMVANRPDWCISRQRTWGVPIVAFKCLGCEETHTTQALVEKVAKVFEREGADAWYTHDAKSLIGDEKCPKCGKREWKKEEDILDVWFESGVSFAAVCEPNPDLGFPVDLYLEGSDQHRGWFHSTLLASVGTRGACAYRACLTHGFVVDDKGEKLSKSKSNYVALDKVLEQRGADLLRLWVASTDFREDVRVSNQILERVGDAYFKVRNTARGILGNLYDFDPDRDAVATKSLPEIDRFMLHRLGEIVAAAKAAYEAYEYHSLYRALVDFCSVDLSKFYIDVLKDRLYCGLAAQRRPAQTVLFETLRALTLCLAPVLSYTAEEIWGALPAWKGKAKSVHEARFPELPPEWTDAELADKWRKLLSVRESVLKELEALRASKGGKSDDAAVTLGASGEMRALLDGARDALGEAFAVSSVAIVDGPKDAVAVTVAPATGSKCERCRRWYPKVDARSLCERCAKAVG